MIQAYISPGDPCVCLLRHFLLRYFENDIVIRGLPSFALQNIVSILNKNSVSASRATVATNIIDACKQLQHIDHCIFLISVQAARKTELTIRQWLAEMAWVNALHKIIRHHRGNRESNMVSERALKDETLLPR